MGSLTISSSISTPLQGNNYFSPTIKCPTLSYQQRRGQYGSKRRPNIVAYYGLRKPPYSFDALEPYLSRKTVELHWGEHHRAQLEKLNSLLRKSDELYGYTMDELVKTTYDRGNPFPEIYDVAAEVWNHDFFWESMQPDGADAPELGLLYQIEKDFGSFPDFKDKFVETAMTLSGSGWVWLVLKRKEKRLEVVKTANAINPIVWDDIPIICMDMWEHAYYDDYKDNRETYANVFINHLVSWHSATARILQAQRYVNLGEPKIPIVKDADENQVWEPLVPRML